MKEKRICDWCFISPAYKEGLCRGCYDAFHPTPKNRRPIPLYGGKMECPTIEESIEKARLEYDEEDS